MLTKQYGAQLSMKTAMAITVMRTNLVMYSFWRTWKWRHSAMKSSRLRRSLKVKNSYMLLRLRSTDRQGYFAESRMTLSLVKLDCVADVIYPRLVTSAQERWNPRTGNAFRISFQPDWQIDSGFCNNHGAYSNPGTHLGAYNMDYGFRRCFADGLSQSLVSSVAQTKWNWMNQVPFGVIKLKRQTWNFLNSLSFLTLNN